MEYNKTAEELCQLIWKPEYRRKDKLTVIIEDAKKTLNLSDAQAADLRKYLSGNFMSRYKTEMGIARNQELFKRRSATFMAKEFKFIFTDKNLEVPTAPKNKGGRPRKSYEQAKSRTTQMKIASEISSTNSVETLTLALELAKEATIKERFSDFNDEKKDVKNNGGKPHNSYEEAQSKTTRINIASEIASTNSVEALTLALKLAKKAANVDAKAVEGSPDPVDEKKNQPLLEA